MPLVQPSRLLLLVALVVLVSWPATNASANVNVKTNANANANADTDAHTGARADVAPAQPETPGRIAGHVRDASGNPLPGVIVILTLAGGSDNGNKKNTNNGEVTVSGGDGDYTFASVQAGRYAVSFSLVNFTGAVRRDVPVVAGDTATVDTVLHLSLNADVTVTGKQSFVNLADVENPAEDLVGIAMSASQGAVTARQIDSRPIMRAGEVLETVPGVIISQHSGEGKANQYYLRGFNLDHGTDFATTVAGVPVNMPTHAHGHGYSDLNFLIPELVSGVQFEKGPYFADQGDFSAAGAANINYANSLSGPIARVSMGGQGWGRVVYADSPRVGDGRLLFAAELNHNDGPWTRGDNYRKVNGVLRYSQGDALNGFSVSGLAYHGIWNSTDQLPGRAIADDDIGRFDTLDRSSGGETSRYSGSVELQRTTAAGTTRATAYVMKYGLDLFSNFTFYLDDPEHGDQFEQLDRRWVSGARVTHRWFNKWAGRTLDNTAGVQLRHDAIGAIGLYHTEARVRLSTVREDAVGQTSGGLYFQNQVQWTGKIRTQVGLRGDLYRFDVDAGDPANGGKDVAGLVSPKGGVVIGPWQGTEFYVNAGEGFHSNDARGATITRDPGTGEPVQRVTPLVRAKGAEVGVRTVRIPKLQSTFTVWTLTLASELLFVGDAGTTEPSRPSRRTGVEWTNYYRPRRWLTFDADLAWSRAHFTDAAPEGDYIPGAVDTVASLGVTVDPARKIFGSLRLRYFGPRPLVEDNSVRSRDTSLVNGQVGYQLRRGVRIAVDLFNLLNATASDIDYYYRSRLPGESLEGVDDIHTHPALPRTVRVGLLLDF
jgi:hypothetical protein